MYDTMDNEERRTEGQRKIMTIGRTAVDITEDDDNVYLADWVIPKGGTKVDGEERRRIVWEMYEIWKTENPSEKRYNKNLQGDIAVNENSIDETATWAYKNYKNVLAFYCFDRVLVSATKVRIDNPTSAKQKKLFKGGYMQIMTFSINAKPYFEKINLIVGVKRNKDKTMYSVTSIDVK
jgi:hypothetical protein